MSSNYKGKRNTPVVKGGDTNLVAVNDQFAKIEAIQAKPLEVVVFQGNFDKAFRAFRAAVQKERVLSVYKERQSYEKPSDKKRRKANEAKRKQFEACSKGECKHTEHASNAK